VLWFISMATNSPGEPNTARPPSMRSGKASILRDGAKTPRLLRMTGEGRRPLTLGKKAPSPLPLTLRRPEGPSRRANGFVSVFIKCCTKRREVNASLRNHPGNGEGGGRRKAADQHGLKRTSQRRRACEAALNVAECRQRG